MEGEEARRERIEKGKKRDIVKMSFPMKRVENTMASYQYSKMYTSSYTNFLNEDECSHQSNMNKVFAIRHLNMAEKRLAAKRVEAKNVAAALDKKWTELHEGQRALKNNFMKFNEFMKENQDKRERATRKIQEEVALQDERKDMLDKLKNQLEYYQKIQAMMVKKIREYRLYEDYLACAIKEFSDFKNVPAVLIRFQALIEAKLSSALKHDREIVALEKARGQLSKLMEEKFTILLGLRSVFGELNSRYESARLNVLSWENTLQEVRQQILHELVQTKCVMNAGKQLHKMMCLRKNTVPEKLDFEKRMDFIKHTLTQLHWLRHVKFAGVKDLSEHPFETRQPIKSVMKQATVEEERQAVKELGKSRLSIFAYLLYESKPKNKKNKTFSLIK